MKTFTTLPNSPVAASESSAAMMPTDEALMAAIQERDGEALKVLVMRYRKLLKCAILRTVHDDAAAEDVLQECLVDLWRHADHYSPAKGKPMAWMMTLCRRRAIDYLRRCMAYSRAKERMEDALKETIPLVQDSTADFEQADMGRVLGQHLALLPPAQQEVIRLAFLKGMSQREVANATHTPLGTVKTRLELGLKKLRQVLRTRSAMHSLQAA